MDPLDFGMNFGLDGFIPENVDGLFEIYNSLNNSGTKFEVDGETAQEFFVGMQHATAATEGMELRERNITTSNSPGFAAWLPASQDLATHPEPINQAMGASPIPAVRSRGFSLQSEFSAPALPLPKEAPALSAAVTPAVEVPQPQRGKPSQQARRGRTRGRGQQGGVKSGAAQAAPISEAPNQFGAAIAGTSEQEGSLELPALEDSGAAGKKRFMWTEDLHRWFVACIFDYGLQTITPKALFESLREYGPPGMTSDHVKSHLQKYRKNSKTGRDRFLRDFQRAQFEAEQKAIEIEQKTRVPPYPPHFSTYPISMPLRKQADPPEALLHAELNKADGRCDRCKEVDELMELGVGVLGNVADEGSVSPPLDRDRPLGYKLRNHDAVDLMVKILSVSNEADCKEAIQSVQETLGRYKAPHGTGRDSISDEDAELAEKQHLIARLMQTQMRAHRAIAFRQENQLTSLSDAPAHSNTSNTAPANVVPLPKSLNDGVDAPFAGRKRSRHKMSESDGRSSVTELLHDIFDIDEDDKRSCISEIDGSSNVPTKSAEMNAPDSFLAQLKKQRPFDFLRSID